MKVGLVGVGYIGLVTGACLAHLGHDVRCYDADARRVEALSGGAVPFREPGLDELVAAGRRAGRLTFHADLTALRGTDLVVIAVGTLDSAGEWTVANVRDVVLRIAADPRAPRTIVVRSTLVPGTAVGLAAAARAADETVRLALCPEFTREGSAIGDFLDPDRIVIGLDASADSDRRALAAIERCFSGIDAPRHVTDLTSAELIKMGSNVLLAAKISYANEIARLAIALGGDPRAVVDGIGLDARIGRSFLSPGPGFGGSCFPSQARILPVAAERAGASVPIMAAVAASNDEQMAWVVERVEASGRTLRGTRVAVLGLTFKAHTDDLRESPALRIAELIAHQGASLTVHDPMAGEAGAARLAAAGVAVEVAPSAAGACHGADVVFVLTEWEEYRSVDWSAVAPTMRGDLIVDARAVVDHAAATRAGLEVVGVGVTLARHDRDEAVGLATPIAVTSAA